MYSAGDLVSPWVTLLDMSVGILMGFMEGMA